MDWTTLLFIFFLITSVQPVIRQKMIEAARTRLLHEIERQRGSRVIALIHRQETLRILGFPLARYLDIEDSEEVLRAIKLTDPEVPIDLILHTPGGLALASKQIAYALCRHPAKVTVFVPHYAMSAGTLVSLAADEIVMDSNAVLGPIDPQLGDQPAVSILSILEQKDLNEIDDRTLILADMARKALRQVASTALDVLSSHLGREQAEQIAETLSSGQWTHDYPISVAEALAMGLNVTTDMPRQVYDLMALHPQTNQRRPSVEYIPSPYAPDGDTRRGPRGSSGSR
jgi:ClpP class serine protease